MNTATLATILFWLSVLALGYTYAGYPILVLMVSRVFPKRVNRKPIEPTVSIIITAYNEERDIAQKLENTLSLDYPKELLEIIVVSDCSSDRTDEIVRRYADRDVTLFRMPERTGKTAAQNFATGQASGEIILFSDATTEYASTAIRLLVPSFADGTIGCVAGRLIYVDEAGSGVGRGARSYWNYETFIKQCESAAGSLIGASGCMYAVRRSAYKPFYHEACSDFLIATSMVEQNLRAVFEPSALCTEETNRRSDREFRMRVRVITQTLNDLSRHIRAMNPLRTGFYAVQLFSHKLLRYFVPLMLIVLLISSGLLAFYSRVFVILLFAQAVFYALALAGLVLERRGRPMRLCSLPFYFCLTNVASFIAVIQFLKGEKYARWEPFRGGDTLAAHQKGSSVVTSMEGEN